MSAERQRVAHLEPYLTRPEPAPTLMKMLVGAQLAGMRKTLGLSQQDVSRKFDCSPAKLCRIEAGRGRGAPKAKDVLGLLDLYGADSHERSVMLQLLQRSEEQGWWQRYDPQLVPEWFDRLIGLQEAAESIRTFELQYVPGLLQTQNYAQAVARRGLPRATTQEIERRTELRMRRQDCLDRPDAPQLWAVMDEAVLHRVQGNPSVMREQVQHLLGMSRRRNISIQIVPLNVSNAASPGIPFTYLRFPAQDLPDVVYIEHLKDGLFIERTEETQDYRLCFDQLAEQALSPRATARLLEQTLRERYPDQEATAP